MLDKIIIYLTEKKLQLKKLKEEVSDKWYDVTYSADLVKGEVYQKYNKYLKSKVDSVKEYFLNIFKDLDSASTPLYNLIWYRSENRIFGYIIAVILFLVSLLVTGFLNMAGLAQNILLLSLLPVSIIPLDIITTTVLFIYNRFKRAYNNSLKRMKKEYNVINDKDLVEAYKAKKEASEAKQQVMNQRKTETKKVVRVKNDQSVQNNNMLTDSEFLEKMFGYVSCSKYVSEENREKFLDEINAVLNKYAKLKKITPGDVNGYLRSDVEHLQSEYSRYISNQEKKNNNEDGYSMELRK